MMNSKNISVFGIFKDRLHAERAVERLKMEGFKNSDVSVLMPNPESTRDFAHEKNTKAPEGAATGAGAGALIGGALGWLAGIGALAIPAIGPLIAAGPIVGLLAGAGAGGAVGGIAGALIGMGIPEYEAKRYEGHVRAGGTLLSVHADDKKSADKAKLLLEQLNAQDISTAGEVSAPRDNKMKVAS